MLRYKDYKHMLVEDAMNRKIITARKNDSVLSAVELMNKHRVGSVLIVDHRLVGIVTERDVLEVVAQRQDLEKVKLRDIMSPDPITIGSDSSLEQAAMLMNQHKIKKLPVIQAGKLVGIVTASDLISAKPAMVEVVGKLLLSRRRKSVGIAG